MEGIVMSCIDHQIKKFRISLTSRCNYKCIFCHNEGGDKTKQSQKTITKNDIRIIAQAASSLGIQRITLTGGEPFLNSEIFDILEEINQADPKIKVSVTTNGILINEYELVKLAKYVSKISLNFQSADSTVFKQMTGVSQLDKVKTFIELALAVKINICLNFVYTRNNKATLDNVILYAINKGISVKIIELIKDENNSSLYEDIHKLRVVLTPISYYSMMMGKSEEIFYFRNSNTTLRIIYSYCNDRDIEACNEHGELRITPSLELKSCLKDEKTHISIMEDVRSGNIASIKNKVINIMSHSNKCPKTLASVSIIMHEKKLLLVARESGKYLGYWETPGGHIEEDETPEEAVIREVKEEAGVDVRIIKSLGIIENNNSICNYFDCELIDSSQIENNYQIKLVSLNELSKYTITPFALENLVKLGFYIK